MLVWTMLSLIALVTLLVAADGDSGAPRCSNGKERMRRALEPRATRKRRTIMIPTETGFECKWAINVPFETQPRYQARIQINLPINIGIPNFLRDPHGLEKFLGLYPKDALDYHLTDEEFAIKKMNEEQNKRYDYDSWPEEYETDLYGRNDSWSTAEDVIERRMGLEPTHDEFNRNDKEGSSWELPRRRFTRHVEYSLAAVEERRYLYGIVEGLLDRLGMDGRECLLRTVCEVANDPMEAGLLGDLFNLLLSPSLAAEAPLHSALELYIAAERRGGDGSDGGRCSSWYPSCPVSLLELLPLVVEAVFGGEDGGGFPGDYSDGGGFFGN